jgi:hypothetical protein
VGEKFGAGIWKLSGIMVRVLYKGTVLYTSRGESYSKMFETAGMTIKL